MSCYKGLIISYFMRVYTSAAYYDIKKKEFVLHISHCTVNN